MSALTWTDICHPKSKLQLYVEGSDLEVEN